MPRFVTETLPVGRELTPDDLHALPEDPWWRYELIDGTLFIGNGGEGLTVDDFHELPGQPFWKFELDGGLLVVSPNAPGLRHQTCSLSLAILLRQACPPELQVVTAPFELLITEPKISMQPDLLVARRPIGSKRLEQVPVLVIEVLSENRRNDLIGKRAVYEDLGVEHYWMVDPAGPSIRSLVLVDGTYREGPAAGPGEMFAVHRPVVLQFDPASLLDD